MSIKKILSSVFFTIILQQALLGQVTNTESFDATTFLPTGWTAVGTTTLWSRRTTSTFPTCSPQAGAGFARFSARGNPAGTAQTIATPAIDYTLRGSNTPTFSFYIYRDNGSTLNDSLSLYINTSASLTGATNFGMISRYSKAKIPDTVAANGWYKYTFNIPSGFTSTTNYILIKGISQAGYNICIDEISWTSYPNICVGKPNPGSLAAIPTLICGGTGNANLTLSGQTTGYAGLSIQWKVANNSTGPFTNTGTGNATLNTGTITSTKYYKCIVSCSYSSSADSTAVLMLQVKSSPNPTITLSNTAVNYCSNASPTKIYASGAKTYIWTPTTGLNSSNTDTVFASPTATTTYQVRGTDTAGCSNIANVTVTLRQPPNTIITVADSTICIGDSLRMVASSGGGGGTTYLWISGKTTAIVYEKPIVNSRITVTGTNTFGCKTTVGQNVFVKQKPIAKFGFTKTGNTFNFHDSSKNASKYFWDFGDGNSSNQPNPIYTYSFNSAKTIKLFVYNSPCAFDSFILNNGLSATNKFQIAKSFSVFPNPSKNYLYLKSVTSSLHGTVIMRNALNQTVFSSKINNNALFKIDVQLFKTGLYTIQLGNEFVQIAIE